MSLFRKILMCGGKEIKETQKIYYNSTKQLGKLGLPVLSSQYDESTGNGVLICARDITKIEDEALYQNRNIQSIIFPITLEKIGDDALSQTSLKELTIPILFNFDGSDTIDGRSMQNVNIIINDINDLFNSNMISQLQFENYTSTYYTEYLVHIIYNNEKIINFTIPENISNIVYLQFKKCSFESIYFGDNVISIETNAIKDCYNCKNIFIGKNVNDISYSSNLKSLESIIVDSDNQYYNDGGGNNCIINTQTNELILGCKTTIIPNTVTTINSCAFYGNVHTDVFEIPDSVEHVRNNAFYNCSINKLVFGENIKYLGNFIIGHETNATKYNTHILDFRKAKQVPTIDDLLPSYQINADIIVPDELYDVWVADAGWASNKDTTIIKASEYVEE